MAEKEKKSQVAETETKKAKVEKPAKAKSDKPSFFSRAGAWCRATKAELKKVVWTPKKDVIRNTTLTLAAMVAFGLAIGLLDYVFSSAIVGLSLIL